MIRRLGNEECMWLGALDHNSFCMVESAILTGNEYYH